MFFLIIYFTYCIEKQYFLTIEDLGLVFIGPFIFAIAIYDGSSFVLLIATYNLIARISD